jgi:hypothetical protein
MDHVEGAAEVLVGRVASEGLADEMKGTFYAVLEAPNGFAYHVPLDARTAEAVVAGDLVLFGTRPELAVRPIDRRIAESARRKGGIYALEPASEDHDRAARRLPELERDGLVSAQGPSRWIVPANLLERLESRLRTEPVRERVWLEKLPLSLDATPGHRGPVWLDQVDAATLAPWGFGADVRHALDQRRDALRAFGMDPDDPHRDAAVRELQRRTVGEGMAAETRQQFVAKTPDRFRGRLQMAPDGAPYAVVTDGTRFVVLPASREMRPLTGKSVAIAREAHGRLTIRALDRDRDRYSRALVGHAVIASCFHAHGKPNGSLHGHDQRSTRSGRHTPLSRTPSPSHQVLRSEWDLRAHHHRRCPAQIPRWY